mmetsp:Transcript_21188/g.35927  ORF Transcript_21188/g.35927 Transcript_21188/m.35927 type:complete len:103 (-) Transcript_21188:57-365(-)
MEIFYWEEAAIGGHPKARYNIGVTEKRNGRFDRAQRHWTIAASQGHTNSVKALVENQRGDFSKKTLLMKLSVHIKLLWMQPRAHRGRQPKQLTKMSTATDRD